jgi:DNA primase
MNKRAKGAFAMVLAGSVTFSVINALLDDQPSKQIAKAIAATISEHQKKADVLKQAEKTVKDQAQATYVKDEQTKLSPNVSAYQADIQQNREKSPERTTTNSADLDTTTTTTSAATTFIATSIKAPETTTTTIPTTTGTNTTSKASTTTSPPATGTNTTSKSTTTKPTTTGSSATNQTTTPTTTTNHGQQVSQTVKASHQDKKVNNGKKFNSL